MKKNLLLIHGWNYRNYTNMTKETDAWHNRKPLIDLLKKEFNIYKLNLPGFCGQNEPKQKYYTLDDFAYYINDYLNKNNINIDYVLGYSFGGPVAITWKNKYPSKVKLILVSPAIIRNNNKSKKFIKTPRVLKPVRDFIRDLYLIYFVKNNEMRYGSKFLRNTYQEIVRKDVTSELEKIDPNEVCIIYGALDKMVNPMKLKQNVSPKYQKRIAFIDGGGHDIANSHPKEIIAYIKKFYK